MSFGRTTPQLHEGWTIQVDSNRPDHSRRIASRSGVPTPSLKSPT